MRPMISSWVFNAVRSQNSTRMRMRRATTVGAADRPRRLGVARAAPTPARPSAHVVARRRVGGAVLEPEQVALRRPAAGRACSGCTKPGSIQRSVSASRVTRISRRSAWLRCPRASRRRSARAGRRGSVSGCGSSLGNTGMRRRAPPACARPARSGRRTATHPTAERDRQVVGRRVTPEDHVVRRGQQVLLRASARLAPTSEPRSRSVSDWRTRLELVDDRRRGVERRRGSRGAGAGVVIPGWCRPSTWSIHDRPRWVAEPVVAAASTPRSSAQPPTTPATARRAPRHPAGRPTRAAGAARPPRPRSARGHQAERAGDLAEHLGQLGHRRLAASSMSASRTWSYGVESRRRVLVAWRGRVCTLSN